MYMYGIIVDLHKSGIVVGLYKSGIAVGLYKSGIVLAVQIWHCRRCVYLVLS